MADHGLVALLFTSAKPGCWLGAATSSARYVPRVQAELRYGRIYSLDRRLRTCR